MVKIGDFVSIGSSNAVGRVIAFDGDRITLDNSPFDVPMTAVYSPLTPPPAPSLDEIGAMLDDVRRRFGPIPEPMRPLAGLSLMLSDNDAVTPVLGAADDVSPFLRRRMEAERRARARAAEPEPRVDAVRSRAAGLDLGDA